MIVSINMNTLHERKLIYYCWIDLDDHGYEGRKTILGSPSMEFMENSGLYRIADEYRIKEEHKRTFDLGEVIYHFDLQDQRKFFMNCMKWGLVEGEDFELLNISKEEVLKFAHPVDTLPFLNLKKASN